MSKGAIKKSTAQAICDAVKVKEGTTEGVPFKDVAERILALPTPSGEAKLLPLIDGSEIELTAEDLAGVTKIRGYAFAYSGIKSLTIPDTVTSIGYSAFYYAKLVEVTIPNSVTELPYEAFYGCRELTTMTIPESLTIWGSNSFTNVNSLQNVYYGGDINSWLNISGIYPRIQQNLYFKNSNGDYELVTKVVIPNTVSEIKGYVFRGYKGLTDLTIGNNITSIGESAFSNCTNLVSVTLSNGLINIGAYVFEDCTNLIDLTIPETVTNIGREALKIGGQQSSLRATIRFLGTTPPTIQSNTIGGYVKKIIVPKGCGDVYKSATNFSAKASIIEEETE